MDNKFNIHTDLAVESQERFKGDNIEISGVEVYENVDDLHRVKLTKVEITSPEGAKIMGKPMGKYVTIEALDILENEVDLTRKKQIGKVLARELFYMLPVRKKEELKSLSVLVVGLGNKDVTPDALGPYVVANLEVTRHIFMLKHNYGKSKGISAMIPGVMAQSGMESAEMVEGIVAKIKPDVVIAIDALAAGSSKRLNSTIQLADTGINPGSGIGNRRKGLNKETIGVPVNAVGVPTVVDV
jgi:spore protease